MKLLHKSLESSSSVEGVPNIRPTFAIDETTEQDPTIVPDSQNSRVLSLANQKRLLRAADLEGIAAPRIVLSRLTEAGLLDRVSRGVYRLHNFQASENEGLETITAKVPQAVFCLLTALQVHGLTTQLPRQVWFAMPRGSHAPRIDYPPIRMVQMTGHVYSEGIETIERDNASLRVYCVAKTVADCFKHRNRIGLDVALEALKDARAQRKTTADELWHYAKVCRVANVMRPYLEATQ